jgi:hypothetical protein
MILKLLGTTAEIPVMTELNGHMTGVIGVSGLGFSERSRDAARLELSPAPASCMYGLYSFGEPNTVIRSPYKAGLFDNVDNFFAGRFVYRQVNRQYSIVFVEGSFRIHGIKRHYHLFVDDVHAGISHHLLDFGIGKNQVPYSVRTHMNLHRKRLPINQP